MELNKKRVTFSDFAFLTASNFCTKKTQYIDFLKLKIGFKIDAVINAS